MMLKREYTIIDEAGLHARPASLLVREAMKHENDILIEYEAKKMTLKSIMAVLSMGIPQGATFTVEVSGDDAESIFTSLEKVLKNYNVI